MGEGGANQLFNPDRAGVGFDPGQGVEKNLLFELSSLHLNPQLPRPVDQALITQGYVFNG